MNMKSPRLDDKLNGIALATILAIVVSVLCAVVSVVADSSVASVGQSKVATTTVASARAVLAR